MNSILALWAGLVLATGEPVTGLSIAPWAERTEVRIAVDGDVAFRDFTMEGPTRLIVDLMGATFALPGEEFRGIDRGGIRAIRASQYSDEIVRVVFELEGSAGYQVVKAGDHVRVILDNPSGGFEPWSTGAVADGAASRATAAATAPDASTSRGQDRSGPATRPRFQQDARRITVSFTESPIRDVLFTFAEFSGKSIVAGSDVQATISADIREQPWDVALQSILEAQGLVGREMDSGIIRVDDVESLNNREQIETVATQAFRVNYATAAEIATAVQGLLTQRGRVAVGQGTNTVVVTDIPRVLETAGQLVRELDVRTPQVNISAKIIFVNRTDLNEFGVTYDLKDSRGNQLNALTPGLADLDGDGQITLPDEVVEVGTDVVTLGGSSLAALGNARNRIPSPTLTLLTSLILGRYTLINFIEALESVNLSDIQAAPQVTVMDNQPAKVLVGERTPLRVIDAQSAGAGAQAGAGTPLATVQLQETGIVLEVTPHVTSSDNILMELRAERSAAELAESDAGFIFRTQEASSRVLVRDGETVVIGGLIVTEMNQVRSGIPLFMDMPVIGRLFRVTRQQRVQRDLLILVTPHIVRDQN